MANLSDSKMTYSTSLMSFAYQKCRPFFDIADQQIKLVKEYTLNIVDLKQINQIVDCYLDKKRAVYVKKMVKRNFDKVGEHYGQKIYR